MRISVFGLRPGTGEVFQLFPTISPCHLTVLLVAGSSLPSVEVMTFPAPEGSAACEPEAARRGRPGADRLISIGDIRALFKLGRTAAYELTRRPGFPAPVQVSSRCLRWWASEVDTYAGTLQREGAQRRTRRAATRVAGEPAAVPRRINGTVRAARGRREQA
jgi:predicted DNA-binding transcriptional regulator AlpA